MDFKSIPLLEGVIEYDVNLKFVSMNKYAEEITGFTEHEVKGRLCHEDILNPVSTSGIQFCLQTPEIPENQMFIDREVYLHHKDGHRVLVWSRVCKKFHSDEHIGYIELLIKRAPFVVKPLLVDEYFDSVTGLVNQSYANAYLERLIEFERTTGTAFGLLILDIDNFEGHNLTYGRTVCDKMLEIIKQSLIEVFGEADLIARLKGDEFILVFSHINSNNLKNFGERLRIVMENTTLRGIAFKEVDMTVSIGGTLVRPRDTVESILQRAMEFLKKSKTQGGNQVTIS